MNKVFLRDDIVKKDKIVQQVVITEEVVKVYLYVACDGIEFDTAKECDRYERLNYTAETYDCDIVWEDYSYWKIKNSEELHVFSRTHKSASSVVETINEDSSYGFPLYIKSWAEDCGFDRDGDERNAEYYYEIVFKKEYDYFNELKSEGFCMHDLIVSLGLNNDEESQNE